MEFFMFFLCKFFSILDQQHFYIILGVKQSGILITFANFNTSQCKQTQVCVDKVVKRPEDPFPCVCESVAHGKSRNVVKGEVDVCFHLSPCLKSHSDTEVRSGGQSKSISHIVAVLTVVLTVTTSVCGPPSFLSVLPRPTVTTGICLEQQVLPSTVTKQQDF